jgi:hypothetical protein
MNFKFNYAKIDTMDDDNNKNWSNKQNVVIFVYWMIHSIRMDSVWSLSFNKMNKIKIL